MKIQQTDNGGYDFIELDGADLGLISHALRCLVQDKEFMDRVATSRGTHRVEQIKKMADDVDNAFASTMPF